MRVFVPKTIVEKDLGKLTTYHGGCVFDVPTNKALAWIRYGEAEDAEKAILRVHLLSYEEAIEAKLVDPEKLDKDAFEKTKPAAFQETTKIKSKPDDFVVESVKATLVEKTEWPEDTEE